MKKLLTIVTLMACVSGLSLSACAQTVDGLDDERRARIVENLKFLFPQLSPRNVTVEFAPSALPGMEQGAIVIDGESVQDFLIAENDTQMYLLAGGPFDVSMTADELAAQQAEREAGEAEEARQRAAALASLIEGLPVRGNPDAPVTIVEFSDFQCPYCSRAVETVDLLLEKYEEDVKLVYLHFPLSNHPWARPAAIASVCAAEQSDDAFWTLHDQYFANQRVMDPSNVVPRSRAFLADHDIDLDAWLSCAGDPTSPAHQAAAARVDGDLALGQRFGVSGTPGFFVNGYFLNGAKPLDEFEDAVERAKANL